MEENEKKDLLVEVHRMVSELHADFQFVRKHRNMLQGTPVLEFDEVCSMLRLSARAVRYLRESGELMGFAYGRRRLYSKEEVDAFISKMKTEKVQHKPERYGKRAE